LLTEHCVLKIFVLYFFEHKVPHLKRTFCPKSETTKLVLSVKRTQQCFWWESESTTKTAPAEIRKCRQKEPQERICDVWQLYSFTSNKKPHCPVQVC